MPQDMALGALNLTKALVIAIKENDVELIEALLRDGAAINATDEHGNTALHCAAMYNRTEAARILLTSGYQKCDIEQRDRDGNTALHIAVLYGNKEVMQLLLTHGADATAFTRDGCAITELATTIRLSELIIAIDSLKQKTKCCFQIPRDWRLGKFVGCGAFGKVHVGYCCKEKKEFAVKRLETNGRKVSLNKELNALSAEIDVLKTLCHPRIVQYFGMQKVQSVTYIFMEYLPGGSIQNLSIKENGIKENQVRVYTKQILEGAAYLHSNMVVHRDIKGANILLSSDYREVKLGDFGLSKRLQRCSTICGLKATLGSPCWMAPEVMRASPHKGEGYGRKADIWSIGCTVIEMLTTKPPWANMEPMTVIYNVGSGERSPDIPDFVSEEMQEFITLTFRRDPKDRPTAEELLRHRMVEMDINLLSNFIACHSEYEGRDLDPNCNRTARFSKNFRCNILNENGQMAIISSALSLVAPIANYITFLRSFRFLNLRRRRHIKNKDNRVILRNIKSSVPI